MSAIYSKENDALYVSAEELCSFIYRGGNLDSYMRWGNKTGACIASHKIRNKKPKISDAYTFTAFLEGVKTTFYTFPEGVVYDEEEKKYSIVQVYTVPYSLDDIDNGELDIAIKAAMLSAYIVSEEKKQSSISAHITFYKQGSDEERSFEEVLERETLYGFFEATSASFAPFARLLKERETRTLDELNELRFPFEGGAREGQRDFIVGAFQAIKTHTRLLVEAPTGTGKTMASLYPSLKSLGQGDCDKIFYFTGKTTTALAALNAIDIMRDQIPSLRSIHITSKERSCVSFGIGKRRKCTAKHCAVTRGYFDKINSALLELLNSYRTYTKDIIDTVAKKYSVCPYELSLELSEWCELIVCDYNYLFDPNAYFRRYFEGTPNASYVFLVDEAHNLPDRAREMYSATLLRSDFVRLSQKYSTNKTMMQPCEDILHKFDELFELAMTEKVVENDITRGFYINSQLPNDISNEFFEFSNAAKKLFSRDIDDDELHDAYMNVKKFLTVCELFDKRYTMYIETEGEELKLRLLCLDPSSLLDSAMKKGISTILFSATLTPLEYFSDVLGCQRGSSLSLASPFDKKNLCLVGVANVSTRYEDRQKSASTVANIIRAAIAGRGGNYIVYFPSYSYLSEVMEEFTKRYPKINVTCQKRSMSEHAKAEFLASFDAKKEGTLVGFCVMGGSFSEGIDLRGERLIGAVIVGVGLPTISSELNIIKEHFDNTRETGYAYAYTYPGMNKVLQAAGRVIRSEDEKGIVFLVDDRFASPEYRAIMPEYWSHIKFIDNAKGLLSEVTEFWKK